MGCLARAGDARTDQLALQTLAGTDASGWAEYWDPDTGQGLGTIPQSWTAVAILMLPRAG